MTAVDLTAEDCERIFHATLKAGDPQGVHAALTLLAVRDPHRAQELLDIVNLGLEMAKLGPTTVVERLRAEADRIERAAGGGR